MKRRSVMDLLHFGKTIMGLGALLLVGGALMALLGRGSGWRLLPGDLHFHRGNFTFYFPVVTCLLLSLLLTLVFSLFGGRR